MADQIVATTFERLVVEYFPKDSELALEDAKSRRHDRPEVTDRIDERELDLMLRCS